MHPEHTAHLIHVAQTAIGGRHMPVLMFEGGLTIAAESIDEQGDFIEIESRSENASITVPKALLLAVKVIRL